MSTPSEAYASAHQRLKAEAEQVQLAARSSVRAVMDPSEAQSNMLKAGSALVQAGRTFYFLATTGPSAADALACTRDFEKAVMVFTSWVKGLLSVSGAAVRKLLGPACARVIVRASDLTLRASTSKVQAADVGQLQSAVEALEKLPYTTEAAASQMLRESEALVKDARREVDEAIDEADSGGGGSDGDDDDDDDNDDDDDGPGLLSRSEVSRPLRQLLTVSTVLISISRGRGLAGCTGASEAAAAADGDRKQLDGDVLAAMLVACAQAIANGVDSTVCAAHDDDLTSLTSYALSLGKVLTKLSSLLGQQCRLSGDAKLQRASDELASCLAAIAAVASASSPSPSSDAPS